MATPAYVPTEATRKQVETMAGFGIPEWDIARVLGITKSTLRRHYPEELATGHVKANAKVAQNLFRIATGDGPGSGAAAMFWMKCRAGWREVTPPLGAEADEIGKKEQANRDALTAQKGTAWDHLLN